MYNNDRPIEQEDAPEPPVPFSTCFLCGAIDSSNLRCPVCQEATRQRLGLMQALDTEEARKQGKFPDGAE
jgi:hypothetical protein